MDERPDLDLGPDPHLNGRGVALTREQRRRLGIVAVLIGLGLVLALAGIAYGLPPGLTGSGGRAPSEVVVDGAGSAVVRVVQDGRTSTARVVLPLTVPIDGSVGRTSVEARLQGRDGGAGIACTVRDASGAVLQQVRGAGDGAAVACTVPTG